MSDLNPRQKLFVVEYLKDLNATQAAIRAGYSAKTARAMGCRLLTKDYIGAAVSKGQEKLAEKHGVTLDSIVSELAKIGFANMQDYMAIGPDGLPRLDWSRLTRDQAAALVEVTVEQVGDTPQRQRTIEDMDDDVPVPVQKVKFKLADKRAALVDLGKHLGMFGDRAPPPGPAALVQINITDSKEAVRAYQKMLGSE